MTNAPQNEHLQMSSDTEPSKTTTQRRRFLQFIASGIVLGLAGCSTDSGGTSGGGSSKSAKNQVSYQDHPQNGKQCSGCKYFIAADDGRNAGTCQKVNGTIANDGWCSLYISR
jgi:hypothetical protein